MDNFVQNAKSHSASYVENSNSALLDDNCSIMIEVSVALIKRLDSRYPKEKQPPLTSRTFIFHIE